MKVILKNIRGGVVGTLAILVTLITVSSCYHESSLENQRIQKMCAFAQKMPKVELHVHLEGSVCSKTLFYLADKNHIRLPYKNEQEWESSLHFNTFNDFVSRYRIVKSCLCTKQDHALIAYEFGKACSMQNICYAEVIFTLPTPEKESPLAWREILTGLNEGATKAEKEFGVRLRWIFDMSIDDDARNDEAVYEFVHDNMQHGIVALGLSSTKQANVPVSRYAFIFDRAYRDGIPVVVHAGEHRGGQSIDMYDAIFTLHAKRIGHGVLCIDDSKLRSLLRQRQIPLEICVTSNISIGVFPTYAAHPVRRLWDEGLFITINSDDPVFFKTNLVQEYQLLVKTFHFTENDLERVCLNAIHASFLSAKEKCKLESQFKTTFIQLRS